ncbi:MAG: hypothetical protein N4A31_04020 [Rickettsiales bacterium]|jgi:hypothetical protein|nr:hypothetical protein [Rickettsiales bacterium]
MSKNDSVEENEPTNNIITNLCARLVSAFSSLFSSNSATVSASEEVESSNQNNTEDLLTFEQWFDRRLISDREDYRELSIRNAENMMKNYTKPKMSGKVFPVNDGHDGFDGGTSA